MVKYTLKDKLTSPLAKKIGISIGIGFVVLLSISFMLPKREIVDGFNTIDQLTSYAASSTGSPTMDNKNIIKPDYTSYYKSLSPGFFGRTLGNLFSYLGIGKRQIWSATIFKNTLTHLLEDREKDGLKDKYIYKLVPNTKTKFYIWGDIQGAYHSLVRALEHLVKQDVLSDDLKIKDPDTYLIFLGDVVSRSPHIMETVTLVAKLVEKNPNKAFYLRGNHENNGYWEGYGLKTELIMRAEYLEPGATIPLGNLVTKFFNTLPIAIYVGVQPEANKQFVRLSHEGGSAEDYTITQLNADCFADFLHKAEGGPLSVYHLKDGAGQCAKSDIEIKALIRSEIKRKTYQTMDGMRMIAPENGVPGWTFLSCPTKVYQQGVSFFYDAFGELKCADTINNWTITIHNQDVKSLLGFKSRTHNLLTGQEVK